MSIDRPNEYEKAVEAYAEAVRQQHTAGRALAKAQNDHIAAQGRRQDLWRVVANAVREGKLSPGIYRLHNGTWPYAQGIVVDIHHDYPDLLDMFS